MKWYKRLISKLDMYLIKKFLGTYFFSIALIISIAVVFDFNENIDKFTTNHAPWKGIIFEYYANFVPYFSNLFSPLFVFISVIFFTSKLAENSEIIAMMAAGMSFKRLMRPYMISAAIIAVMTFLLGAYVIPKGSVTRLNFENIYKKKKKTEFAQNVQLQVDTGVIAFIEHFDGRTKTGYHFSLDKFVNKKLVSHLTAASVSYDTLSDERYHWRINNYTLRELKGMREYIHFPWFEDRFHHRHGTVGFLVDTKPTGNLDQSGTERIYRQAACSWLGQCETVRGGVSETVCHPLCFVHSDDYRPFPFGAEAERWHGTVFGYRVGSERFLYFVSDRVVYFCHQCRLAAGFGGMAAQYNICLYCVFPL